MDELMDSPLGFDQVTNNDDNLVIHFEMHCYCKYEKVYLIVAEYIVFEQN